jgi:hypothetical protein
MRLMNLSTVAAALTAAALGFGVATPASAIVMSQISTADQNDGVNPIYGTDTRNGWYGADLHLFGGPADVTVTFLGREAEFDNMFLWDGVPIFSNSSFGNDVFSNAGFASQTFLNVDSGLLPFSFSTPNGDAVNGSNPDNVDPGTPNFFASWDNDENGLFGPSLVMWLDDANEVDDNHDDMAIRISVSSGNIGIIPLPASVFMLLAALGGLGLVSRRRTAIA